MIASRSLTTASRKVLRTTVVRAFSTLPDSIKRVGRVEGLPLEYPGMNYAFNWCLNGDGVTPLKGSAFRISKPLDLKVAGLSLPATNPLKVEPAAASKMPEAGSEGLGFEEFDDACEKARDLLSLADHLYCPEGDVPTTRMGVRVITNSATIAPEMLAYLDRTPRVSPPDSLPITVFVLEGDELSFSGYSIEEIEVPVDIQPDQEPVCEAKSAASVVVAGPKPDIKVIVAGIEFSQKALAEDEIERAAKKAEAEKKEES